MRRYLRLWRLGVPCVLALLATIATATGTLPITAATAEPAPTVEVFTDSAHPVTRREAVPAARLTVYRLDGLIRLQQRLSEGLPADKDQAARIAGARFQAQHKALRPRAQEAAQGLVRAQRHYGLDRYPAVVFDARAVVYGVTDLAVALRLYQSAMGTNP